MMAGLAVAPMVSAVPMASAAARAGVRVRLPAPSGPHEIGTVSLHLVDRSRPDPWDTSQPYRELMVSVWYPALRTNRPFAAHMEPGAAERFDAAVGPGHGITPGTVDWAATRTHAREGAPADTRRGRRPVVLYSPGAGDPRTWGTAWVEEPAGRGYVVVSIDHTYESPGVRFPDGSVRTNDRLFEELARAERDGTIPALLEKTLRARVGDTRFVLNRLAALPRGLSEVVDPHRVGMFGHSAGGFTAAQSMYEDRRIRAGIDMDGTLEFNPEPNGTNLAPVAAHGLRRPFALMGSQGNDHTTEPSWGEFWSHSRGRHRDLTLRGSKHQTCTDLTAIMPQTGLPRHIVEEAIGRTDPVRAVVAVRAYVTSFFDLRLRHRDDHLLDGPSPRYPEVTFVR
jgi:dienelactone hydrolase